MTPASQGLLVSAGHMPAAEVDIDTSLVRRLLAAQFPQWADLPVEPVDSAGWDNTIYRLGADLAVRLPRRRMGAGQVEKQHRWLPVLAPLLPLAIPVPLGKGVPTEGYPWHWTVSRWLGGEIAAVAPVADPGQAAIALAQFVAPCRRSTLPAARAASSAAFRWRCVTESPGPRSTPCAACLTSAR